ncbi:DUF3558 domain-containing protein [Actinokineospora sp. PR83]|uniref:DUF3558 domain-containing protein n=1 Tax=Actinokineospora sp. PR83 TaxID=2884908 RepID=UPI001F2BC927|nr:DUF3558 domain-containing protein [Actinokineospora sp. PR83]MCG8916434.1 DUF3558 domain-containing protein [Actinokineospora sp. PR83]
MSSRLLLSASIAVLALGAVACTTSESGTPTSRETAPSGPPSGSATTQPPPTVDIPARPADLKLDSVDPCALMTTDQLKQLKVNRTRSTVDKSEAFAGAKECVLDVSEQAPYHDYRLTAVTTEGIGPWLTGKRNVEAALVSVGGYGAAQYFIPGDGPNSVDCTTTIDVAPGQQLMVSADAVSPLTFTQEQLCQMSQEAAELALATLRASR